MPNEPKSYSVGGEVYDIPDAEVQSFLKDNPNATEVSSWTVGKDTFDIPVGEVDAFLKDNPQAKNLKKKIIGEPLQNGGQPVSNNTPTTSTAETTPLDLLTGRWKQNFPQQNLQNQQPTVTPQQNQYQVQGTSTQQSGSGESVVVGQQQYVKEDETLKPDFGLGQYKEQRTQQLSNELGFSYDVFKNAPDAKTKSEIYYGITTELDKKEKELDAQNLMLLGAYGDMSKRQSERDAVREGLKKIAELKSLLAGQSEKIKQTAVNNIDDFATIDFANTPKEQYGEMLSQDGLMTFPATNPNEFNRITNLQKQGIPVDEQSQYLVEQTGYIANKSKLLKQANALGKNIPTTDIEAKSNAVNAAAELLKKYEGITFQNDNPAYQSAKKDYEGKLKTFNTLNAPFEKQSVELSSKIKEVDALTEQLKKYEGVKEFTPQQEADYNKLYAEYSKKMSEYEALKTPYDAQSSLLQEKLYDVNSSVELVNKYANEGGKMSKQQTEYLALYSDYKKKLDDFNQFKAPYEGAINELKGVYDNMKSLDDYWDTAIDKYPALKEKNKRQSEADKEYEEGGFFTKAYYNTINPALITATNVGEGMLNVVGNTMAFAGFMNPDKLVNSQNKLQLEKNLVTPKQQIGLQHEDGSFNWDAFAPTIINVTGQSFSFLRGGNFIANATKLPMGASQFASVFLQTQGMFQKEAMDGGMNFNDSQVSSAISATTTAFVERLVSEEKLWKGLGGLSRVNKKTLFKDALALAKEGGKGDIKSFAIKFGDFAKSTAKTLIPEVGEELVDKIGQDAIKMAYNTVNDETKLDVAVSPFDMKEIKNTILETSVGMLPLALLGGYNGIGTSTKATLFDITKTPQQYIDAIEDAKSRGKIDEKKYNSLIQKIAQVQSIGNTIPTQTVNGEPLSEEQKVEWVAAQYAKQTAVKQKETLKTNGVKETEANKQLDETETQAQEVITAIITGQEMPVFELDETDKSAEIELEPKITAPKKEQKPTESPLTERQTTILKEMEGLFTSEEIQIKKEEFQSENKTPTEDVSAQQHTAGYSTIALDYLFTGGRDVIQSTDYLLQALVGGFTGVSKEIDAIRNKYADKIGNIKDDINSDVYNQMMEEIRGVINEKYNNSKAEEIFDKILENATGFTNKEGNKVSIELDKLNEQTDAPTTTKTEADTQTEVKVEEPIADKELKNKVLVGGIGGQRTISQMESEGNKYDFIDLGDGLVAFKELDGGSSTEVYKVADTKNPLSDGKVLSFSIYKNSKGEFSSANKANLSDHAKRIGLTEKEVVQRFEDAKNKLSDNSSNPPKQKVEAGSGGVGGDVDLKQNGKKIISKAIGGGDTDNSDFSNTKVVDESGKPKQVFHGTWADAPFEDFKEGDTYFTDNYNTAKMFGSNRDGGVDAENMDMQGKPFVMEVTDTKGKKTRMVIANTDMASIFSDLQYNVSPVGEWGKEDLNAFDASSIEYHFGIPENKIKSFKIEERQVGKNVDDFGVSKHYINLESPLIIDAKGDIWNGSKGGNIQGKINEARKSGKYDGVIVKNIVEGGLGNPDTKPTTTYVVFNKQNPVEQSLKETPTPKGNTSNVAEISDTEYNDFIDKGKVSDERLNDIANKVKNQQPLSDREKEIFTDKTGEINKIIKGNTSNVGGEEGSGGVGDVVKSDTDKDIELLNSNPKTRSEVEEIVKKVMREDNFKDAIRRIEFLASGALTKHYNNDFSYLKDAAKEIERLKPKPSEQSLKETTKAETKKVEAPIPDVPLVEKKLEEYKKNNPTKIDDNGNISGGLFDAKMKAISGDKKPSVTTPSKISFLPDEITVAHITDANGEKGILKSGFKEKELSNTDHPIQGIYFTTETENWRGNERYNVGDKLNKTVTATIKNEGLLYFDNANDAVKWLEENDLPSNGATLNKEQLNKIKELGVKGIVLREDLASQNANELIVLDKSIISDVKKGEGETTKMPSSFSNTKDISEAYHKAKKDGSNPELVKAVEDLLGEQKSDVPLEGEKNVGGEKPKSEQPIKEEKNIPEKKVEGEGFNLKDINGQDIKVGDKVSTTQSGGGVMPKGNSETGIVEKTKDAFGNDALQIKYRKEGDDFDRYVLLNGKTNEIVKDDSVIEKKNELQTKKEIEKKADELQLPKGLEKKAADKLAKEQKEKLLADLNTIEDIILGKGAAKKKAEILADDNVKSKDKNETIGYLHNQTTDIQISENTKALKKAGFEVKDGKIKVDIYKDGEIAFKDVRTAIETVEREFPNKSHETTTNPSKLHARFPKQHSIGKFETLEKSKQALQDASDNYDQAKKDGNKEGIEYFKKQLDLEKEAYHDAVNTNKRNKENLADAEALNKKEILKDSYEVKQILDIPKYKKQIAKFEGTEYNEETPNLDLAERSLQKEIDELQGKYDVFHKKFEKQDGTLKKNIGVGDSSRLERDKFEITALQHKLDEVKREKEGVAFNETTPPEAPKEIVEPPKKDIVQEKKDLQAKLDKVNATLKKHYDENNTEPKLTDIELKVKEKAKAQIEIKIDNLEDSVVKRAAAKAKRLIDKWDNELDNTFGNTNTLPPFTKEFARRMFQNAKKSIDDFVELNKTIEETIAHIKTVIDNAIEKLKSLTVFKELTAEEQKEAIKFFEDKRDEITSELAKPSDVAEDVPLVEEEEPSVEEILKLDTNLRSVLFNLINNSKLDEDTKKKIEANPEYTYDVLHNAEVKKAVDTFIKKVGLVEAENFANKNSTEPVIKIAVLGGLLEHYNTLANNGEKFTENEVDGIVDIKQKLDDIAISLAQKGTAYGQAIQYINAIYKMPSIAYKKNLKKTLERINKYKLPKAKKVASDIIAEIEKEYVPEVVGNSMQDEAMVVITKKLSELEAELADVRKQLKEGTKDGEKKKGKEITKRFTNKEDAQAAIRRLLGKDYTLGIIPKAPDPIQQLKDLGYVGLYYAENVSTKFSEWAKEMRKFAKGMEGKLVDIYNDIKRKFIEDNPENFSEADFSTDEEIDNAIAEYESAKAERKQAALSKAKAKAEVAKEAANDIDKARKLAPQKAAKRINEDAKNLNFGETKPKATYLSKLTKVLAQKAKEYYGQGIEKIKESNEEILKFALENGKRDFRLWEDTQTALNEEIDADETLTDEQKEDMKDFLDDYIRSSFDILLTNSQVEKLLRERLIADGYATTKTINGKEVDVINWGKFFADTKNTEEAKNKIAEYVYGLGYDAAASAGVIDSIHNLFDETIANKKTKAINKITKKGVINKIKSNINTRTRVGKLISMNGKGMLTSDAVLELLAEELGLTNMSEADWKYIDGLLNKMDKLGKNVSAKSKVAEELAFFMEKKSKNVTYKAGRETLATGMIGSIVNIIQNATGAFVPITEYLASNFYALVHPKKRLSYIGGLNKTIWKELSRAKADMADTIMRGGTTRGSAYSEYSATSEGETRVRMLEYTKIQNKILDLVFRQSFKGLRRLLDGVDNFVSAISSAISQYDELFEKIHKENPTYSSQQIREELMEQMYSFTFDEAMVEAQKNFDAAGIVPTKQALRRAAYDIIETARPTEAVNMGELMAQITTGKKATAGLASSVGMAFRYAAEKIRSIDRKADYNPVINRGVKTADTLIFGVGMPFIPSIANWTEMVIELTPYGMVKGAAYATFGQKNSDEQQNRMNNKLAKRFASRALSGVITMLLIGYLAKWMMDDDDDDAVTGDPSVTGEKYSKSQIKQIQDKSGTVHFGDTDIPAWMFGNVGLAMLVMKNYTNIVKADKKTSNAVALHIKATVQTLGIAMFQALAQRGSTISSLYGKIGTPQGGEAAGKFLGNTLSNFIPFNKLAKDVITVLDPETKESDGFLKNFLGGASLIKPFITDNAIDYRGREFPEQSAFGMGGMRNMFVGNTYGDDMDKLLALSDYSSAYVYQHGGQGDNKILTPTGKEEMSDEQYRVFRYEATRRFNEKLTQWYAEHIQSDGINFIYTDINNDIDGGAHPIEENIILPENSKFDYRYDPDTGEKIYMTGNKTKPVTEIIKNEVSELQSKANSEAIEAVQRLTGYTPFNSSQ